MPRAIIWTQERDRVIGSMRAARYSWDDIAKAVDVSRRAVIERAAALGMDTRRQAKDPEPVELKHDKRRPPLPANHPLALQVLAEAPPLKFED